MPVDVVFIGRLTILECRSLNFLCHGTGAEGVERLNDHAVTRVLLQVRQVMLPPGHGRSRQAQSDTRRRDPSLHSFVRVLLRAEPVYFAKVFVTPGWRD